MTTVRPGEATTKPDSSSNVGVSRPPIDRIRSPGWMPAARGSAARLDRRRRPAGSAASPNDREKYRENRDRQQEIGDRPGKHDQESLPDQA